MKKFIYVTIILLGILYISWIVSESWGLGAIQVYSGCILGGLTVIAGAICFHGTTSDLKANKRRKILLLSLSVCYLIVIFLSVLDDFHWLQYLAYSSFGSEGVIEFSHIFEQQYYLVYITCLLAIYHLILLVIMIAKDSTTIERIPESPEKNDDSQDEKERDSKLKGTLIDNNSSKKTTPSARHDVSEWTCPWCEQINKSKEKYCECCGRIKI